MGKIHTQHYLSFSVSECEWDDLPGQIADALAFVDQFHQEIGALLQTHRDVTGYLDFPVYSRLNDKIICQSDSFSPGLIQKIGTLGLGLMLSTYKADWA